MTKFLIFMLFCLNVVTASSQEQNESLIEKGAKVTKAGGGYLFTEGPSVAPDGRVFFTDQPNDKIEVWSEDGTITTYLQPCGRSNGTYFNQKGELVACADLSNRLVIIRPDKQMKTIAENYDGKHLNAPNDLWIAPEGGIYFSDPYYFRDYWEAGHQELQDVRGVYYLNPEGKLIRVIDDYKQPNGLIGTPDGKTLYVSDINDGKIWKYSINQDGTLSNKTLFAPEGSDGMTIDNQGNVYLTNKTVSVFDKTGKKIAAIEIPEQPSNVCFGGKKRNILFITARTSVYTLKMKVKGVN
ncbi:MAG TPA: SMP-30/gluconolactonase/LRE family protein [Prolixibacteraceae bacterium]|nr:SMP-30/gluconolactonase/LRE family protein [Prolixibacteraceae bacterium]